MSISEITELSTVIVLAGIVFCLLAWFLIITVNALRSEKFHLNKDDPAVRVALALIILGTLSLATAIMGYFVAFVWWMLNSVFNDITPTSLALFFLILGPFPLLLTLFSKIAAKLIGGSVNSSQALNYRIIYIDIGSLLYTLFMSYRLAILTGGISVLGLLASGLWAGVNIIIKAN